MYMMKRLRFKTILIIILMGFTFFVQRQEKNVYANNERKIEIQDCVGTLVKENSEYFIIVENLTFLIPTNIEYYSVKNQFYLSDIIVGDVLKNKGNNNIYCLYFYENNSQKILNYQILINKKYLNINCFIENNEYSNLTRSSISINIFENNDVTKRLKESMSVYSYIQNLSSSTNSNINARTTSSTTSNYYYDSFTNTNNIIKDYSDLYYGNFRDDNNLITDDPIVQIIPKELCFNLGRHLYVGKEYGFFINTSESSRNLQAYEVDVFIFDIIFSKHDFNNDDFSGHYKIEPLFSYAYLAVDRNLIASWTPYDPNLTQVVYPDLFSVTEDYVMYDFGFKHTLENETALNYGDDGYSIDNDNGSFFIGSYLSLNARDLNENSGSYIDDILSFAFGKLVDTVDKYGVLGLLVDIYNESTYEETIIDNYSGVQVDATNKFYQKQKYGKLLKQINIIRANDSENMPLIGLGNYIESSYIATCDSYEVPTRVYNAVHFKIGCDYTLKDDLLNIGNLINYAEVNTVSSTSNYVEIEVAKVLNESIDYSNEEMYYIYVPTFNGKFIFQTTGSLDTYIYLFSQDGELLAEDDNSGSSNNGKIKLNLVKGEKYYLKVIGLSDAIGNYSFKVLYNIDSYTEVSYYATYTANFNVADSYVLFRFSVTSGTYVFETTNSVGINPYIILLNSNCNQISIKKDGGSGYNAKLTYSLNSGTYYILISSENSMTGRCNFYVHM